MDHDPCVFDADSLRQLLMSHLPMQRIKALHALEVSPAGPTVERAAAARFAARGVPFYSANDPHYRAWVDKAVGHWERLNDGAAPMRGAPSFAPAQARHA